MYIKELTQEVCVLVIVEIRNTDDDRSTRNTAHTQNTSQGGLRSDIHLEVPHKEDGEKSQDEITAGGGDTIDVGHINDGIHIHAVALDIRLRVDLQSSSLPEE